MTESEWNACDDANAMLVFLSHQPQVSARKLRFFACACLRRLLDPQEMDDEPELEVSEQFADGKATEYDLRRARSQLGARGGYSAAWAQNNVAGAVIELNAVTAAKSAAAMGGQYFYFLALEEFGSAANGKAQAVNALAEENARQAVLLRHFRPPAVPTEWPARAVALAEALYQGDDVAFALHDALSEAGLDEFAEHFKEPLHPKGCAWMDAILGKA